MEDEDDFSSTLSHMTLHLMTPEFRPRSNRQSIVAPSSRASPAARTKAFFDELINLPSPREAEAIQQGRRRSRLVYIRDYPTLAASASSWYPSLLASVRQRRQGPISRPSSPVTNSMTIVFGITPPIIQPSSSGHGGPLSLLGLMNSRPGSPAILNAPAKKGKHDYGEDEHAEKSREKRLRERLRRWERDDQAFLDDLPRLAPTADPDGSSSDRPGIVIVGAPGISGSMTPAMPPAVSSTIHSRSSSNRSDDGPDNTRFFRVSVLVPTIRNLSQERICRVNRRREINELTMRMGIGAVGGRLEGDFEPELLLPEEVSSPSDELAHPSSTDPEQSDTFKMWDEWGKSVEIWPNVKAIADRAVGSIVAQRPVETIATARLSLEDTPISWSSVIAAWSAHHSSRDVRKVWVQESAGKFAKESLEEDEAAKEGSEPQVDDVIQRIKDDPDLTTHEQRLLGCIIDAGMILF